MLTIEQIEIVVQDSSKSTGISGKIEGENTMEKHLRVFRAHSCIFLWRSEVIELLNRYVRVLLMKRNIAAQSCVNKHEFAHVT